MLTLSASRQSRRLLSRSRPAFSLIELAVVLIVVGVIAAIAIPTFVGVMNRATDRAVETTLGAVVREASALASFRGESTYTNQDLIDAAADLPSASGTPGVQAAATVWVMDVDDEGFSGTPGVISAGVGGSPAGTVAGLASLSPTGSCAFARSTIGSAQTWVVTEELGAGCSAAAALAGPEVSPLEEPTTTTTESTTTTTTAPPPPPVALTYVSSTFTPTGVSEVLPAAASGGVGPYTFAVTSGTVPAGVGFDTGSGSFTGPTAWPHSFTKVTTGVVSCGIDNVGGAWCWGPGTSGRLGNGSTAHSDVPVRVTGLASGVTDISTGNTHSCAVHNGAAKCWGDGFAGKLGNGGNVVSSVPVQVSGLTANVSAVSVGGAGHTCAIHSGAAKCWGSGTNGQLGNSASLASTVVVNVTGLGSGVTSIAAGSIHTCAVHNGAAKCWGDGSNGRLGRGSLTASNAPVQVTGLTSNVTRVTAAAHSCAVHNGAAKCWGIGFGGRLGNGGTTDATTAANVTGLGSGVTVISAGSAHTCAVHNGAGKCWGLGSVGRLGNGGTANSSTAVQVTGLTSGVTSITAGSQQSCAVHSGAGKCFGYGANGTLGNAASSDSSTPVNVVPPSTDVLPAAVTVTVTDSLGATASAALTLGF